MKELLEKNGSWLLFRTMKIKYECAEVKTEFKMVLGKNRLKTLDLEHCAAKGRCAVFLPWKSWEKTWSAFLQSHHEGVVSLSGRLGLSWPISLLREGHTE